MWEDKEDERNDLREKITNKESHRKDLHKLFLEWIKNDPVSYKTLKPNLTPHELATELGEECMDRMLDYFIW